LDEETLFAAFALVVIAAVVRVRRWRQQAAQAAPLKETTEAWRGEESSAAKA